ncbi:hypothetical protein AGMMS50249_3930 [candidate division SR1 bacterium]|nr:hypothetical protein AGMMS50249_3930 [candidate division SR1 bacterium]
MGAMISIFLSIVSIIFSLGSQKLSVKLNDFVYKPVQTNQIYVSNMQGNISSPLAKLIEKRKAGYLYPILMTEEEEKEKYKRKYSGRNESIIQDIFQNFLPIGEEKEKEYLVVKKYFQGLPVFDDKDIGRPENSKNIGRDINNPGNLVNGGGKGAIGVYKSPNGRYYTVFVSIEDGYEAMITEIENIKTKLTNNGRTMRLSSFLSNWIFGSEGQIDKNSYYRIQALGIARTDKSIMQIDNETLGKIIMIGEATRDAYQSGGKDLSHLSEIYIDLNVNVD